MEDHTRSHTTACTQLLSVPLKGVPQQKGLIENEELGIDIVIKHPFDKSSDDWSLDAALSWMWMPVE